VVELFINKVNCKSCYYLGMENTPKDTQHHDERCIEMLNWPKASLIDEGIILCHTNCRKGGACKSKAAFYNIQNADLIGHSWEWSEAKNKDSGGVG
jgi:hypothetical protein